MDINTVLMSVHRSAHCGSWETRCISIIFWASHRDIFVHGPPARWQVQETPNNIALHAQTTSPRSVSDAFVVSIGARLTHDKQKFWHDDCPLACYLQTVNLLLSK